MEYIYYHHIYHDFFILVIILILSYSIAFVDLLFNQIIISNFLKYYSITKISYLKTLINLIFTSSFYKLRIIKIIFDIDLL
jgi:hypothetical protein